MAHEQIIKLASAWTGVGAGGGKALSVQGTPVPLPGQIAAINNLAGDFGNNVIKLGIDVLIFAAAFIAFGYLLFGGWKWMTSQGDKKAIEEARNTLIWAVVGMIVIALAFLVVNVILRFFQVPVLTK